MPTTPLTRYLLDTSILLHYVRGDALAQRIEDKYSLRTLPISPLISIVSVGEIQTFALANRWGKAKLHVMDQILGECIIVTIDLPGIVDAYAEFQVLNRKMGRPMGDNDVWIAATAGITQALLLTTDKDFDHLDPVHIDRDWIDPAAV